MEYAKIWEKTLGPNEEVKYEFSVSKRYRKILMVATVIIGILFFYLPPLAIGIALLGLFYFGFYLKVANAYAFTNDRVLIHKGWLSTKLISTEYQKITDVTVHEPFISRIIFKTGHLTINTAGTGAHEITLRHVERPYELKKKLDGLRTNR
ncbi:PH domain-containing protein [Candidatus Parcubacteria bacterium]|nr:MAG: PH domain-containing protein [Candidatus Parcubacteria bacterium]